MIVGKYGIYIAHVMRTHAQMFGMVDATSNTAEGDNHVISDDGTHCFHNGERKNKLVFDSNILLTHLSHDTSHLIGKTQRRLNTHT